MILLTVPAAFVLLCGLLFLASHLERKRVAVMVRMTVKSPKASPELAEALVAAECAPVLAAYGFSR